MFLVISPGNFDQLSFFDSTRGELYRVFGDPIGMAGRSLVEGLFGIHPNALAGTLTIKPGFPAKLGCVHRYIRRILSLSLSEQEILMNINIIPTFPKEMNLVMYVMRRVPRL